MRCLEMESERSLPWKEDERLCTANMEGEEEEHTIAIEAPSGSSLSQQRWMD